MSLEQAIIEHAGALKELAAAIRETLGSVRQIGVPAASSVLVAESLAGAAVQTAKEKAAEMKKTAEVKPDAELEKAVSKVEAAAAKGDTGEGGGEIDDDLTEQPELVYATDVRPVLLTLNKTKGKDELAKLLKKYNAPNGDKIKPADFAAILADANALLAA